MTGGYMGKMLYVDLSSGMTIEEALKNLKEATELYLEEFSIKDFMPPLMTTFEVAEIAKA